MKLIIDYVNSNSKEPAEWIYFSSDNWDDFGYKTTFYAEYKNINGKCVDLGSVKIGYVGMQSGRVSDKLPNHFDTLPKNFFSLGSTEDYYVNICSLGDLLSKKIYCMLRDIAYDLELFYLYKNEDVLNTSLLRGNSIFSVKHQLNRIAHGGVKLTQYNFKYIPNRKNNLSYFDLEFDIEPDSNPPTNIHVLIGRNGTGKTYLIKNMIKSLISEDYDFGRYYDKEQFSTNDEPFFCFANVLCVAFSPFDDFSTLTKISDNKLPFSYIGLNKEKTDLLENILNQFIESFFRCMDNNAKIVRWENTIDFLRSDPTFQESQVYNFLEKWRSDESIYKKDTKEFLKSSFNKLSSGHKVVLLIVTACVDKLEEKSIIFFDEPENHLHPPLLSAFIRALSYLLINRNSVAIVSTHSPVILQEVPKSCVWKLCRSGSEILASRVEIETFGATIGSLTRDVFGLEVNHSGFNKMLSEEVNKGHEYYEIINKYGGELGEEARHLLQTLLIIRENEDVEN